MYFKRLEMHGFKSFADPVVIEFHEGVTCVVGPNGSGKSNISDALRWVLGEQSPKTLRGGKMEEVIFAGSASRKNRGMAEVTLVIDNTKGILDIDYSEVSITRRMFRSGESEYLINNVPCRLRDIRNLIMDTGIGVDGYSIIGQGKIAEIVSNKPESRREIFEEAAGVVAYKSRKAEAERRLESTNGNLLRANDIISEIESRIDSLKSDSDKAKEYLELKEKYQSSEVNVILRSLDTIKEKTEVLEEDIFHLENEITTGNSKCEAAEKKLESLEFDLNEIDLRNEESSHKLLEVVQKLNRAENSKKMRAHRLESISEEEKRLSEEIENIEERIDAEESNFRTNDAQIQLYLQSLESKKLSLDNKIAEYNQFKDEEDRLNTEINNKKDEILRITREISKSENESSAMESMGSTLEVRFNEITVELGNSKEQWETINKALIENKNREQELTREKDLIAADIDNKKLSISRYQDELSTINAEINKFHINISQISSRKKTIEEMEANYEGYNYGVKYIMKSQLPGIRGVVGESMRVPEGLETAVETALGGAMQNIICDKDEHAKKAISVLKQNNSGRLTFLPIETVQGTSVSVDSQIKSDREFIGIASEQIQCAEEYRNIFNYLLGRVVLVETLDGALRLSKRLRNGIRLVTRSGEVINSSGAITGGRYKNQSANLLSRRGEISKLENEIKLLNEDINNGRIKGKQIKIQFDDAENAIRELTEKLNKLILEESSISVKINMIEKSFEELTEKRTKLEQQLFNIQEDKTSSTQMLNELESNAKNQKYMLHSMEEELEKYMDQLSVTTEKIRHLSEEKTELTIENNSIKTKIEAAESISAKIKDQLERMKETLDSRKTRLDAILIEKTDLEDSDVNQDEDTYSLNEEKQSLENTISQISKEKDLIRSSIISFNKEISDIRQSVESLQSQKYQEEIKFTKNQTQQENLVNRLWDEFEFSLAQAAELRDPDFIMATGVKIGRDARKRLRELGDVNVGAIKEYDEVSKRYEFLKAQREDILDGMNELKSIITEMSTTIQRKFKDSFNSIVINFEEIFTELFGGGYAQLTMEDENDPLNSGIEIVAQPPGKKLQNINLMSGGEKTMTAIALMFAVLKAKPTPFCILDEVEAALDDNNIDRFSEYLRKFENIQFVLVTHQKATMEHADVLYGVTMAEQGVSKLLSLKLGDKVEL